MAAHRVGLGCYDPLADSLHWDDEAGRMHGRQPGAAPTDLDRDVAASGTAACRADAARPFSADYRVRPETASDGSVVVLVGAEAHDAAPGRVDLLYVDVTAELATVAAAEIEEAVAAAVSSRIVIERAKGALMLGYSVNPHAAFEMLRWWSRNHNVKLRTLAGALIEARANPVLAAELAARSDAVLGDLGLTLTRPAVDR
ncbi:ANTAR domain-containing protein [Nocardioides nitrophenolicus]|uniref:ANTAR domain-containing protein n=1 Tax=Nocardioides nitrophenolicus TaxID=60489 RepID=UPI0019570C37|nr:ANTAR domain-containing protein [Nocardioides nitrophenolicus]MBM7516376.1 hypothetical protein [Nocardioides nitrophenolicus]